MRQGSVTFEGVKIVRLNDTCTTRDCSRVFHDHGMVAILQKNGNVAVTGRNLFNGSGTVRTQERYARALWGLKLMTRQRYADYQKTRERHEHDMDVTSLRSEADRLGYAIKPASKPRKALRA